MDILKKMMSGKGKLVLTGVVVVVALLIVGAVYYWGASKTQKTHTDGSQLSADDQRAQDNLKSQIDKETDTEKKTELMYEYGDYYINSGQYDNAIENARAIEKLNATAQSAGLLGDVYAMKGDYKNAVKYYDLAMSRSKKPASESMNAPYNDYRVRKEEAEAKL